MFLNCDNDWYHKQELPDIVHYLTGIVFVVEVNLGIANVGFSHQIIVGF